MRLHHTLIGLVVAVALLVPVTDAVAGHGKAQAVPPALVGTWTRLILHVPVGTSVVAGSRFTATIKKDGTLDLKTTDKQFGNWVGTIWGAGPSRLRMEIIGPDLQYFHWRLSKGRLVISDWPGHSNFVDHDVIFRGTWTKR